MSETSIRILVVALIVLLAGVAYWSSQRTRRAVPVISTRDDLPAGVHLFTSTTCAACSEARAVVAATYGTQFREIRFEDDPDGFAHHRIARAPTTVVVRADGSALVFEGVPHRRHLPSMATIVKA